MIYDGDDGADEGWKTMISSSYLLRVSLVVQLLAVIAQLLTVIVLVMARFPKEEK